jgi:DNA replication protein DnaC
MSMPGEQDEDTTRIPPGVAAALVASRAGWAGKPERRRAPDGTTRRVSGDAVVIPLRAMHRAVAYANGTSMSQQRRDELAMMTPAELDAYCDALEKVTDDAAVAAAAEGRRVNRYSAYLRHRNPKYAGSDYGMLRPDQLHGGKVSRWWSSPRRPRSVLMAGRSRTGKTTAGYAIANEAHTSGAWVEVFTEIELTQALRDDTRAAGVWSRVVGCDLLFLDDWGRARGTDWWKEQLQELLDIRIARAVDGHRLLVTANTPGDQEEAYAELVERYGDPIVERVIDGGGVLMFDGPRIRDLVEW